MRTSKSRGLVRASAQLLKRGASATRVTTRTVVASSRSSRSSSSVIPASSSAIAGAGNTALELVDGDGYVRKGKVFALRLSAEERERIESFARALREHGTIGWPLFKSNGRVSLGPFLVWCAGALEHELKIRARRGRRR
jgi:hypothetical protein